MKIGFFTTGFFPVNKDTVKATEHFVFQMAERLSKKGHEVFVFGAEGSAGNFQLVKPKCPQEILRKIDDDHNGNLHEYDCYVAQNFLDFIDFCEEKGIQIIHEHTMEIPTTLARYSKIPIISTLHGVRAPGLLSCFYRESKFMYNIAPSHFVAEASSDLDFFKVIPHGVDANEYNFVEKPKNDFIFAGRLIPDKGPIDAIQAAELAKENLVLGGYPLQGYEDYYEKVLEEIRRSKFAKFMGKINRDEIPSFMANGKALLMTTKCDEAFGLVMIEAMAGGTPVITYDRGTAREIIEDGVTGYIVKEGDINGLARAMKKADRIDRRACRERVEKLFSIDKMINDYEQAYEEIIRQHDKR